INSSRSPNFGSWELKVVPLVLKNGEPAVKETMAITMLDPDEVAAKPFEESHVFGKLRIMVAVARLREDDEESRSTCRLVHAFDLQETALYDAVAEDYHDIQRAIREHGFDNLSGVMGRYIQPRTKGAGHGSTSRAFYARKEFVEYIIGMKPSPPAQVSPPFSEQDCPIHAGQTNTASREPLDARIGLLPANQSGVGRHKCPYCAYERGYQQALTDITAAVGERQR
ncbi:MAG: MutH/Sau3AI family endonuclease, partial [Chloroflexota bacterium]|nr:MutH/Sau3AI family endonuclease [Chloroflexota bacterium]